MSILILYFTTFSSNVNFINAELSKEKYSNLEVLIISRTYANISQLSKIFLPCTLKVLIIDSINFSQFENTGVLENSYKNEYSYFRYNKLNKIIDKFKIPFGCNFIFSINRFLYDINSDVSSKCNINDFTLKCNNMRYCEFIIEDSNKVIFDTNENYQKYGENKRSETILTNIIMTLMKNYTVDETMIYSVDNNEMDDSDDSDFELNDDEFELGDYM